MKISPSIFRLLANVAQDLETLMSGDLEDPKTRLDICLARERIESACSDWLEYRKDIEALESAL